MKLNPKTVDRILKLVSGASLGTGTGLLLTAPFVQAHASNAAGTAIEKLDPKPYWRLRLSGHIPWHSKVLTTADEVADHILGKMEMAGQVTKQNRSALRRAILKDPTLVKTMEGRNAMYAGRTLFTRRPVYIGSPKGMNPDVAAHETGHYRADKLRPYGHYEAELTKARLGREGLKHLFGKNMDRMGDGSLSQVGIENEAWDQAPKSYDPKLRRVAVDSYRGAQRSKAMVEASLPLTAAGTLASTLLLLRSLRR